MRSNLRKARERAVLTLEELGQRAGLDSTTVGMVERGLHAPRPSTRRRILEALGLPLEKAEELFELDRGEA